MVETKYGGTLRSSRKDKTLAFAENIRDANLSEMQDALNRQLKESLPKIAQLQTTTKQLQDTVDGIAVSGGASVGSAVTYDNTLSGLDAQNVQNAIDEIVNNLGHYETNEEWLRAYTDAEDKFLWGIRVDGSIDWSVGIPKPIQKALNDIIANNEAFQKTLQETLETYKQELNEQITNLQDTKVDKEEGKSLIDDEVKECFKVIENEEFIRAITDSEDRILFGIYRETGKPYFPLNDMYHVEQNEEFFAAWLDAADHVLLGIRRDGQIIGEIHAVNALKQVISQIQSDVATLQEKVGTIDASLQELLSVFSLQDNEEYLAVEEDADGKVLSCTNPDGSHYINKVKSETIPTEFEHIEDPEGRMEITTDADGKMLGYRDKEGTRHEHKISAKHLELSDEAATEVNNAFKLAGIKMENPSDFSKDSLVELSIPRIAAQVRIYAPKLPTTKTDDIEAEIEYNDKDGNYFRKPVILNAQGSSSMGYYVKNMAIDLNDGSEIKFGDFPTQDSFHLKKYYIDAFRGQCIVGYWLMEQVYKSRPLGQQYPYEYSYSNDSVTDGLGDVKKDFFTGAKCHPDGFPIIITWVNSETKEETWMGIYTWNLKKSKEVYNCDKKKAENIILDGSINNSTLFGDNVNWSAFEIRNPKNLVDIDGNKYDGDNPKELSDTDPLSKKVKDYILRFQGLSKKLDKASDDNERKQIMEEYFIIPTTIDYFLVSQILYHFDGFDKNWIWIGYDGKKLTPSLYDVDSIFGMFWNGTYVIPNSSNTTILNNYPFFYLPYAFETEIKERYAELRNKGIFSEENIVALFEKWISMVGFDNYKKEFSLYSETPSYRDSNINDGWELVEYNGQTNYDNGTTYNSGDTCSYMGYKFKALRANVGVAPLDKIYENSPKYLGFHNSIERIKNWLVNRISFLDTNYKYLNNY